MSRHFHALGLLHNTTHPTYLPASLTCLYWGSIVFSCLTVSLSSNISDNRPMSSPLHHSQTTSLPPKFNRNNRVTSSTSHIPGEDAKRPTYARSDHYYDEDFRIFLVRVFIPPESDI